RNIGRGDAGTLRQAQGRQRRRGDSPLRVPLSPRLRVLTCPAPTPSACHKANESMPLPGSAPLHSTLSRMPPSTHHSSLVTHHPFRGYIFDLDGTVYLG